MRPGDTDIGESRDLTSIIVSGAPVLYPFLAAIFPIVSVLSSNAPGVPLSDVTIPVLGMLGATTLVWFTLGPILRDRLKRGLMLLGLIALFWSYGPVLDMVRATLHYRETLSGLRILSFALFEFSIATGLFMYLRRTRRSLTGLTRFLNTASAVGVALAMASATFDYGRAAALSAFSSLEPSVAAASKGESRDIVYIIADAYGRHDVLRDLYGYDNTAFVEALEARGFYVARNSRANYNATRFSVASSLNYRYVEGLAIELGGDYSPAQLVRQNRLFGYLKERGYRFVSFATGHSDTEMLEVDEYLAPRGHVSEFQQILMDATPRRSVMNRLRSRKTAEHGPRSSVHDAHRARVLFALKGLREMEWTDGPEFVFTHILSPHWPFVLDEFSNPVYPAISYNLSVDYPDWEKPTLEEFTEGYRKQVQGLNRLLLETIDAVQQDNPDAIIILQGDHGPRRRTILPEPGPWETYAREELAILNAYYLPGVDAEELLYPEISPVNTFRVILNAYFQENLPLLEDRSYLWVHLDSTLYPVPSAMIDGAPSDEQNASERVAARLAAPAN